MPHRVGYDNGARAARGATLLIMLQVGSRAATFVANQLLLRFLTAQLLGVATQLEVYYLSVIFFARESLRVAIQRQDTGGQNDETNRSAQAAVNLGSLAIALGIPLAGLFGWLYLGSLSAATLESAPNLVLSLYVYALASVVELLSEPAFVVMQIRLQFGTRATAESVATVARCAVTLGAAVFGALQGLELGVLPFALGQLSYGAGLLLVYSWYGSGLARREGFSLLPRPLEPVGPFSDKKGPGKGSSGQSNEFVLNYFYRPTLQLASSMAAQSVLKHMLTQGDTFMVSFFSTPTAQGVYALANNYGGLVARLLFQPIEESSRSYFSRLLAPVTTPAPAPTPQDDDLSSSNSEDERRGKKHKKKKAPPHILAARRASSDLRAILKVYALLSLVIVTLGPTAAPLLLSLVAGPAWANSGAGACLAAYMWYIPLLAVNGVAEAFVASVATEKEVHWQSLWMGAFSAGFAGAGFIFLRVLDMGAIGLVVANCINMLCRIVWCAVFIRGYFARTGVDFELLDLMPDPYGILAAVISSQLVKRFTHTGGDTTPGAAEAIVKLIRAATVALPFVFLLMLSERRFLHNCYRVIKGKRRKRS
ncbi:oligosaccharide translocation protein RFT1, variant [Cercophora newfieldiana]|uniref:Man(5)GlcNAc(2)-PP-dolichol translocation protein RFT1 n=1 Tax=Cercophora newfieldiana TaxID=92897 RepID=A0AA39XUX4_9PEZI|nr:oligosaccharide translocation protein RFT1, variant [Cercophora newfieldiana]